MKVVHFVFIYALVSLGRLTWAATAPTFEKATPEQIAKGKTLFAVNCASCHGSMGAGDGPAAAMLNPKPRNLATEKFKAGDKPDKVYATVTNGLKGTIMPGFGHLSIEERKALVYFIESIRVEKK